ncbi:MAG: hypothetical protein QHH07_04445 [Sedimentisphaerales bacterium]|nr:hypothetical protein [Sedimentisphaerales bacterium]
MPYSIRIKAILATLVRLLAMCAGLLTNVLTADEGVADAFAKLREQYQSLDTFYLKSTINIAVHVGKAMIPPTKDVRKTRIEYESWGTRNGSYKVVVRYYDANGVFQQGLSYAYDGKLFQTFDHVTKVFAFGREDPDQLPMAPENPLFAPVRFLSRDTDNCRACTLKLGHILSVKAWQDKQASAKVLAGSGLNQNRMIIELPYGVLEGKSVSSRVYFGETPAYLPTRIDLVDQKGTIVSSTGIVYKAMSMNGKATYWPDSVRVSTFSDKGEVEIELTAQLEDLRINGTFPEDTFAVDHSSARAFWDRDAKTFVDTRPN